MIAVIFKATLADVDEDYFATAAQLRKIAMNDFNCQDFISVCQNNQEISISYWLNENDICNWKQHRDHLIAQSKGRDHWYQSYQIEVCEIQRSYSS